jgi:hypothetical protein
MRCPKCGYISFDRIKSCDKCRADLTAVATQLQGTVGKIAPPFFLGAALGTPQPAAGDSGSALYEKDEPRVLGGSKAEALPADQIELDLSEAVPEPDELDLSETAQDELDLSEAAPDEINPEEQPLPPLDFKDIDLSDLAMPRKEEEELELSLGSEPEEALLAAEPARDEEEDSLREMEPASSESDDLLIFDEQPPPSRMSEAESGKPPAEDEDIIDLSSLMGFAETPAATPEQEEDAEVFDLFSLGEEPEELHLSLEDSENRPADDEKKAPAMADIPDLGLTLENDDRK